MKAQSVSYINWLEPINIWDKIIKYRLFYSIKYIKTVIHIIGRYYFRIVYSMNIHILCIYWGLRVYPKKVNIQNTSTYYSDEGNGILLQYSCLENPMDREDWQATVQGVAKSWAQLSDWASVHTHASGKLCV